MTSRQILKVGLAVIMDGKILLVRKQSKPSFILPGGKPENLEDDYQALQREISEELGCEILASDIEYLGTFRDETADERGSVVTIRLYCGSLSGNPRPCSEIEEIAWYQPGQSKDIRLAPSLSRQILPFLFCGGEKSSAYA